MNYSDFMKSKHIAERWGEAQAALESTDQTPEVAYYQELLNDFYDYIQYLESKTFATNDEQANHEIIKDEVEKKKYSDTN